MRQVGNVKLKKAISVEGFVTIIVIIAFFFYLSWQMEGAVNMFKTMMATAYDLLITSVFYIMAIAVVAGAFSGVISEFGVVSIINKGLAKIMKPLYGLPGASSLGILTTYLSDNPAILTLAKDKGFRKYFKRYQLPALTNLGTCFGMGLIVTTFMIGLGGKEQSFVLAALVGNLGAFIGGIVSVRLMLYFTKRHYGDQAMDSFADESSYDIMTQREVRDGTAFERFLDSILEGGKNGVEMGLAIIPGVLIIATVIMMLTNGPGPMGYTGEAYQGVALLPKLAGYIDFIIQPVFGLSSPEAISVPLTSIGAVGAAITLVPNLLAGGLIGARDIAVFTAMGMCWSGYLSTHVAMMDSLDARKLTTKAIISHTIGGLAAGISANLIYTLITLIF